VSIALNIVGLICLHIYFIHVIKLNRFCKPCLNLLDQLLVTNVLYRLDLSLAYSGVLDGTSCLKNSCKAISRSNEMLISTPVTPKALNGFRWNFEQAYRPNYVPLQVGLAYTMQIHVALWRELSGRRSGLWTVHSEVYHWVFVGIFIFSLMFLMSEFLGRIAVRRRSLLQTGI